MAVDRKKFLSLIFLVLVMTSEVFLNFMCDLSLSLFLACFVHSFKTFYELPLCASLREAHNLLAFENYTYN